MEATQLATQIEELFGYPLATNVPLLAFMTEQFDDMDSEDMEAYAAWLVGNNIHWQGEFRPGQSPADLYDAKGRAELGLDPVDPKEKPADLLARHLCGLFAVDMDYKNPGAVWLVDLNPSADGLADPVYYQSPHSSPRYRVLDSLSEIKQFGELLDQAEDADADRNIHELNRVLRELVQKYPRATQAKSYRLRQLGIDPPAEQHFDDSAADRLFAALDALTAIAEVLVQRAKGERAVLPADVATACERLIEQAPDYPPNLAAVLIGGALSAKRDKAHSLAERILEQKLGVALTERWATMVVNHAPPFDS